MSYFTDSDVSQIPLNAVGLGFQYDLGQYFLALTISEHGLIPGEARTNMAWFGYGGVEINTTRFAWITVPHGYTYKLVKSAVPPNGALRPGYQKDVGDLYTGITHTKFGDLPGKVHNGICYFPNACRELTASSFSYVVISQHDIDRVINSPSFMHLQWI